MASFWYWRRKRDQEWPKQALHPGRIQMGHGTKVTRRRSITMHAVIRNVFVVLVAFVAANAQDPARPPVANAPPQNAPAQNASVQNPPTQNPTAQGALSTNTPSTSKLTPAPPEVFWLIF